MGEDSLHDGNVREDDGEERHAEVEDEDADSVGSKVVIAGEVIEGAGVQDTCAKRQCLSSLRPKEFRKFKQMYGQRKSLTLRNVLSPAEEGRQ